MTSLAQHEFTHGKVPSTAMARHFIHYILQNVYIPPVSSSETPG